MTTHTIKLRPEEYDELFSSNRDFDVQMNTRAFNVGDEIHFVEHDFSDGRATGRMLARTISLVIERVDGMPLRIREGLRHGYCLLGLRR
jgi:hypothetical protein